MTIRDSYSFFIGMTFGILNGIEVALGMVIREATWYGYPRWLLLVSLKALFEMNT